MTERIIREFTVDGVPMVLVLLKGAAHAMSSDKWRKAWGKRHPEHWGQRGRRRRAFY